MKFRKFGLHKNSIRTHLGGVWCLDNVVFWTLYSIRRRPLVQHKLAPPATPITRWQESIVAGTYKNNKQISNDYETVLEISSGLD